MSAQLISVPPDTWDSLERSRSVAAKLADQIRPDLAKSLSIKPSAHQAAAHSGPWAEIPFAFSDDDDFNSHPHFTVAIQDNFARIQVTVPHHAKLYWAQIRKWSDKRWLDVLSAVDAGMTRVQIDKVYREPLLTLHIHQRRFRRPNDAFPNRDGYLLFDVDSALDGRTGQYPPKSVPEWFAAFKAIVRSEAGRSANLEVGLAARFPRHAAGACHGPNLADRMAEAAVALEPFVKALRTD